MIKADPNSKKGEFTIRVYGLLLHPRDDDHPMKVLVMDEIIKGRKITKFPGGGLEYGEGLKDCLVREIKEELLIEATGLEHFYTTDHFQQSTFHNDPMQVISVYYTFQIADPAALPVLSTPFTYSDPAAREGARWLTLFDARADAMSLPIDRIVLNMLLEKIAKSA